MYQKSYQRLQNILETLREKCPWDKKQTFETLRNLTIEETYELAQAIDHNNFDEVKEELGDVLLHILFYALIAQEKGAFDIGDVIDNICNKLVQRHPHIYSNIIAETEEKVKQNWENLKIKEGRKSILAGVPATLPAIIKALRIQEKAKQVGFEWDTVQQVQAKVEEEFAELAYEINQNNIDKEKIEDEFGDVLFSLVNYARFLDIDPEKALEKTNKKFMQRFLAMEQKVHAANKNMQDLSLQELDNIWNEIKKETV